jgi:hypothetical protein
MLEFGEKHHLSSGEPVTCALLNEGHGFTPPLSKSAAIRDPIQEGRDH